MVQFEEHSVKNLITEIEWNLMKTIELLGTIHFLIITHWGIIYIIFYLLLPKYSYGLY